MFALIKKDIQEHALPFLGLIGITAAFPHVLLLIDASKPSSAFLATSFMVVMVTPIMTGHWLINIEKTKRTLFLLRMLPMNAHHLATAKELVALGMLLIIGTVSIVSSLLALFMWGLEAREPNAIGAAWISIGMILFTQLILLSNIRFDHRLAIQVPYGSLLLLVLAHAALRKYHPDLLATLAAMAGRWYAIGVGYLVALTLIIGLHLMMVRLLERTDWSRPTAE